MQVTLAVLDTNTFLQYQAIGNIPWNRILGSDRVELLIVPVVVRELDRFKDQGNKRQKDRARTALKLFRAALTDKSASKISAGVTLRFIPGEPTIDFASNGLSRDENDDKLIASLLGLPEYGKERVALVTRDVGPSIKGLALGVEVIALPEKYEISDEPDPDTLTIRELERQIRELRSAAPDLRLTYPDGTDVLEFLVPHVPERPVDWVGKEVAKQRAMHRRPPSDPAPGHPAGELGDILRQMDRLPNRNVPTSEIERYDCELEDYLEEFADYLHAFAKFEDRKRTRFLFTTQLTNIGTAVAEDMQIRLHIPDGLNVTDSEDQLSKPVAPEPPVAPRTETQIALATLIGPTLNLPSLMPPFLPNFGEIRPQSNVSEPKIRHTNSYEVIYKIKRLKHGYDEEIGPLYLDFASPEEATSFHVDYRVDAANLPRAVVGKLHVVVKR